MYIYDAAIYSYVYARQDEASCIIDFEQKLPRLTCQLIKHIEHVCSGEPGTSQSDFAHAQHSCELDNSEGDTPASESFVASPATWAQCHILIK